MKPAENEFIDALREGLGFTEPILDESSACIRICQNTNIRRSMMKDAETAIGLVGSIKERLDELKEETKMAILDLAEQSCEVDMCGFIIRQSFSYYDEEVYHIDKINIDLPKKWVKVQLREYANSMELSEFSIEDQIGIYEELAKTFSNSKCHHRIDY